MTRVLLAFEGTGMSGWGGNAGLNDLSNTSSYVWKFHQFSSATHKKYFPGPNIQGSNCDDILKDAKEFYQIVKKANHLSISLVGYSRGAYIAMCFAQYLRINRVPVHFMGLFDAVSVDMSVEAVLSTKLIPNNVATCYHAYRAEETGSRRTTMNRIGRSYWNGGAVQLCKCPGSHAALGGFPNQAGVGDEPTWGQGDPQNPRKFDHRKELTAWWMSGNHISTGAMRCGVLQRRLVGAKGSWFLSTDEARYRNTAPKMPEPRPEPHRPRY